jgi:hypothetical protein
VPDLPLVENKGVGILFYTNNSYMTVFVRNAAYLANLLLKASRFRHGNKSFDFLKLVPSRTPQKGVFYEIVQLPEP